MTTTLKAPSYSDFENSEDYYAAHKAYTAAKAEAARKLWTYKGLDAWMQGRNHDSRKIARNTYLKRRGDSIAVKLHDTDVVTYHPDGSIELNTGGWKTMTTKDRIDGFTPAWLRISSVKGVWHVLVRDLKATGYWEGKTYRFFDGITFGPKGGCRNPMSESKREREDRANRQMDARIATYVTGWIGLLSEGAMPLPSNGDCWYCCLFPETDHEAESHLLEHMDDEYYVPSLLLKAVRAKGYANAVTFLQFRCGLHALEGAEHFATDRLDVKEIRKLLTWYMRKHLRTNMAPPR